MNLATFSARVYERTHLAIEEMQDPSLRTPLTETLRRFESDAATSELGQPLSLLYLVLNAWKPGTVERAIDAGASCTLYLCSLDLLDDVQDADLAGKPCERVGMPVALNCGLALMFLAFDTLRHTAAADGDGQRALSYLGAFNRASIAAVAGQQVDLMGGPMCGAPEQVLRNHRDKASSVGLFLEVAAVLCGCGDELVESYRRMGSSLAGLVQILDDLRDIFGKEESPDLRDLKRTYPLACFERDATPEQRKLLAEQHARLPSSLPEVRELFYEVGVVEHCAEAIESLRSNIHREVASTHNDSASHRVLLSLVDALASAVYSPEPIAETAAMFDAKDDFSIELRRVQARFRRDLAGFSCPDLPTLTPWHLPHFEFEPERRTIHYPDLDGLRAETAPFYVALYDCADQAEARGRVVRELPMIVGHECVHSWRHAKGRLTDDYWHEEYVANRVATAYARHHSPESLASAIRGAKALLVRQGALSPEVENVVRRSKVWSAQLPGYGLDRASSVLVHARMLVELAEEPLDLRTEMLAWLGMEMVTAAAAE